MSFFTDPRYRQERIFMVFTIPALLIATLILLFFLFWKGDREMRADHENARAAEIQK